MIKPRLLVEEKPIEQAYLAENIFHSLQAIQNQLQKEITSKQRTIERQESEIQKLRAELEEKSTRNAELNEKLVFCQKQTEGGRQLINKLLNDLDRLQQNVEWYKRTYETRSVFGVIKDRIKYFFIK